jgi:hypothetical protein
LNLGLVLDLSVFQCLVWVELLVMEWGLVLVVWLVLGMGLVFGKLEWVQGLV